MINLFSLRCVVSWLGVSIYSILLTYMHGQHDKHVPYINSTRLQTSVVCISCMSIECLIFSTKYSIYTFLNGAITFFIYCVHFTIKYKSCQYQSFEFMKCRLSCDILLFHLQIISRTCLQIFAFLIFISALPHKPS